MICKKICCVWVFKVVGMCLLVPFCVSAQHLVYITSTAGKENLQKIHKQQYEEHAQIDIHEPHQTSRHLLDTDGSTREWAYKNESENTTFVARREGNSIHVEGTFKNRQIQKTIAIDEQMWLNKIDHGLSDFASSDAESITFWTLKLTDLEPIQFEARKLGTEMLQINGKSLEAVRIKLKLNHFLMSKLWSASLWYRASDGLFLKYEGAMGAPGTPVTTIEIREGV